MVGQLFQNYDTIYVRIFPTYTCNHSCYTIYVRFLPRILTFFPALWGFYFQLYDHFLSRRVCNQLTHQPKHASTCLLISSESIFIYSFFY